MKSDLRQLVIIENKETDELIGVLIDNSHANLAFLAYIEQEHIKELSRYDESGKEDLVEINQETWFDSNHLNSISNVTGLCEKDISVIRKINERLHNLNQIFRLLPLDQTNGELKLEKMNKSELINEVEHILENNKMNRVNKIVELFNSLTNDSKSELLNKIGGTK